MRRGGCLAWVVCLFGVFGLTPAAAQTIQHERSFGSQGTGPGQFENFPTAIAADSFGNVYVTNGADSTVDKFASDGTFLTRWGTAGTGEGQFQLATGIAVNAANRVFVADRANGRVQEFTSSGVFIRTYGQALAPILQ